MLYRASELRFYVKKSNLVKNKVYTGNWKIANFETNYFPLFISLV